MRGLSNNQYNNILLEGLAEGRFFQECLRLYHHITLQAKSNPSLCLYAHGYAAVVKSACQLKRIHVAESLLKEMKQKNETPLPSVYFEMCDVVNEWKVKEQLYENRSDWKKELRRIQEKLNENGNGLSAAEFVLMERNKEQRVCSERKIEREEE